MTVQKFSFDSSPVKVSGLNANLDIQPWPGQTIEVSADGEPDVVKNIKAEIKGGILVISGGKSGKTTVRFEDEDSSFSFDLDGPVNILSVAGGGYSSISVIGGGKPANVTVRVPFNTALDIAEVSGSVSVGDTNGNLKFTTGSGSEVSIGKLANATLNIGSSKAVSIDSVGGELKATLASSARLEVSSGFTKLVDLNLASSAEFDFGGVAGNTSLVMSSSAKANFPDIRGQFLNARVASSAVLNIEDGAVEKLSINGGSSSSVTYDGSAVNADINIGSSGRVRVKFVKNKPSVKQGSSSRVEIGNW